MSADPCCDVEEEFDEREAAARLREHRLEGPPASSRRLIAALVSQGIAEATVLDVGAGVGSVHLALLTAGAAWAVDVDASQAYLAVARQEAERLGVADRVAYRHGDLVALATELDRVDVVTLDRVICCYRDMATLVGRSAELSRRLYGLVYPRDTWWWRPLPRILNAWNRLRGSGFRVFVHRDEEVEASLRAAGFRQVTREVAGVWQVRVFERVGRSD